MKRLKEILGFSILSLILGITLVLPISADESTEIEKFDFVSEIIQDDIESRNIDIEKIISDLDIINIRKFNIETGNDYGSVEELALEIFNDIKVYEQPSARAYAFSGPIYEGGLNKTFSGWNYYGAYLDKSNTAGWITDLEKMANTLAFGGVVSSLIIGSMTNKIGGGMAGILSGWQVLNLKNAILDLKYYNGTKGTRTTINKYTNVYRVRSQNNECAYNCPAGGGGGSSW